MVSGVGQWTASGQDANQFIGLLEKSLTNKEISDAYTKIPSQYPYVQNKVREQLVFTKNGNKIAVTIKK